jgi:hypothetical protein
MSNDTTNTTKDGAALGYKNAYLELMDQSVSLAQQSTEAAKKMVGTAFDAQTDVLNTLVQNKLLPNAEQSINQGFQFLESATKQANHEMELTKSMFGTFYDVSLAWQKMALEAQKNAVQTYASWLQMFRVR